MVQVEKVEVEGKITEVEVPHVVVQECLVEQPQVHAVDLLREVAKVQVKPDQIFFETLFLGAEGEAASSKPIEHFWKRR